MDKKAVITAFLLLVGVLVVIGAGVATYVILNGVSAREQPGAIETMIAGNVRNLAVGRRAKNLRNPVERAPEIIAEGRAHFADHCAVCHANDGSGKAEMGQGMFPKAPDMRQSATQNLTDGELFYIIEQGIRFTGMPGWSTGTLEGEQSTWHLVHFIRHLPDISQPEIEEMARLNPRSPEEIRQEIEAEQFLSGADVEPSASSSTHEHGGGHE
jgi:mono/diheme cytochrome c family protein